MKCKLSDICSFRKGKIAVEKLNTQNYISTENMLPNKGGITEASSLPTVSLIQEYKEGDVLVSNIRPYFKKIWQAKYDGGCSNDILVFVPKSNTDRNFLYYVLADDDFFTYSMATSKGTKMPRGDKSSIMQYEVPMVDLHTQKKIASILKSLDEKIELNNVINNNLEQQAQALYQQMFIDNASSNWKEGTLSDIANITMGQSPSGSSYNEDGSGTIFFQGRAEFGFRFPSVRLYTTEPKRIACANDTLMSVRAPVGDLNVAHTACCIGRGLAAIHSKNNHQSFVLYTMHSLKKRLDIFNGEGTVFGSINRNSLNEMPLLMPSSEKLDEFEKLVAPMDAAIRTNYDEICHLEQLRDTLLPKLMSGELDVSNIEI
ncbi:MAG: restriction endonuclease subunit S [Peptococcaceae bacterium]